MTTHLLFGQAGPSGHEIWIVLGGAAVLASIAGNYAQWLMARRKRERVTLDQPVDIRIMGELVRKDECQIMHQGTKETLERLAHDIEGLRQQRIQDVASASLSRKNIYDQIDAKFGEVKSQMAELPSQIVAQLLNTKRLWGR
jgi:hypothetical protein